MTIDLGMAVDVSSSAKVISPAFETTVSSFMRFSTRADSGWLYVAPAYAVQLSVRRQRLRNHLIHVVVAIGSEPPNKLYVLSLLRERQVFPIQPLVCGSWHWIVRISLAGREFV